MGKRTCSANTSPTPRNLCEGLPVPGTPASGGGDRYSPRASESTSLSEMVSFWVGASPSGGLEVRLGWGEGTCHQAQSLAFIPSTHVVERERQLL